MQLVRGSVLAGIVSAAAAFAPADAADIAGAGSTFAYPIYAKWAEAYKKETGVGLSYRSIGSADGIRLVESREVTFAATDMPLRAADLDASGLVQFPTLTAGVVSVVNIDGVKPGELTLDGATLARIFLGEIKSWSDPAVRKLNPKLKLPSRAITVVYRSDGSGTTFLFTDYLTKVSVDWKSKIGSMTSVEWPVGVGAAGNEGVASKVASIKGAIGYVEYAYARQNSLSHVKLMNRQGNAVAPNLASFAAAAANADWEAMPGFGVILTNEAGAATWPITGATFILVHKQPGNAAAAGAALKFFDWAYAKGGKIAEALDYVPVPAKVVAAVHQLWS
ncbi:MAG TPA: phosphate ABC transporter substrate-binding protein PstS, partial [Xanthobacteraceae bacterium]